jgi:competence protein ComGC
MKTNKRSGSLLIITCLSMVVMLLISSFVIAQQPQQQPQQEVREDFTDEELTSFVKAHEKVIEIQQKSQEKMINAIEKEGLSVEKFNELIESQQDPDKEVDASAEELASFNNAAQQIMQERQKIEVGVVSSIEDEGLDIDTYQAIIVAYQQSPEVQGRINELLQEGQ